MQEKRPEGDGQGCAQTLWHYANGHIGGACLVNPSPLASESPPGRLPIAPPGAVGAGWGKGGPTDPSPPWRAIAPGGVSLAMPATCRPLQSPLAGLWRDRAFFPGLRPSAFGGRPAPGAIGSRPGGLSSAKRASFRVEGEGYSKQAGRAAEFTPCPLPLPYPNRCRRHGNRCQEVWAHSTGSRCDCPVYFRLRHGRRTLEGLY